MSNPGQPFRVIVSALALALALALIASTTACSDDTTPCSGTSCRSDGSTDASGPDWHLGPDLARDLATDTRVDLRADALQADTGTDATRVDGAGKIDGAPYLHEDISVQTLDAWIKASKPLLLIDVRETTELANTGVIAGTINKPWSSGVLQADYAQLPKDKPVVLICASGNRSNQAATFMAAHGFEPVYDMLGGMAAWKGAGLPTVTP